jgi:hypothetical protein
LKTKISKIIISLVSAICIIIISLFLVDFIIFYNTVLSPRSRSISEGELRPVENFIDGFYVNLKNPSFEMFNNYFLNEKSYIMIRTIYHYEDSKVMNTETLYMFSGDMDKWEAIKQVISSLGYQQKKILVKSSIEDIYDVPVSDLICLDYRIDYQNKKTYEKFWLKMKNNTIYIYKYEIGIHVYEKKKP